MSSPIKPPVVKIEVHERALHLGDVLNRPVRVLCACGGISSIRKFRLADDRILGVHKVLTREAIVGGASVTCLFMHRDDVNHYIACVGILDAQENN